MARKKKEHVSLNFRCDKKIFDQLEEYCARTGLTKTSVVERAISLYLEDQVLRKMLEKRLNSHRRRELINDGLLEDDYIIIKSPMGRYNQADNEDLIRDM